ncbi:MAG: hypothetical protein AAB516_01645 [Patescibacteria group bacterium]
MIKLSNGFEFTFLAASGSLGFDGRGWPHPKYWFLRMISKKHLNLIVPVIKTLTLSAQKGDLKAIYDGDNYVVNAVGLDNPGFNIWKDKYLPKINRDVIISISGNSLIEIKYLSVQLAKLKLNNTFIKGIEFNSSCPNVDKKWDIQEVAKAMEILKGQTRLPVGIKIGYHQKNYLDIALAVSPFAEWISFNSVPWEMVFPGKESPLIEKYDVSGAVSGKVIKEINRRMALKIQDVGTKTPIISSSIGWQKNIDEAYKEVLDALKWSDAVSFGSLFRKHPTWPIKIAKRYFKEKSQGC